MSKITKKFKISQMIILRNIIDSNFKHPTTKLSLIPANFITFLPDCSEYQITWPSLVTFPE